MGSVINIWLRQFFFDKEYILILWRYQLHPASATMECPNGITDAHSQKIQEELQKKKKSRYIDLFLVAAVQPPPRQHYKFSFSKSDTSKKEIVHKSYRRPIIDHRFSP
jgi:hypothetical protein